MAASDPSQPGNGARLDAVVARAALPRLVIALGVTSLLTDVGTEMIFPLLPVFLVESLGASGTFLGLIEGAADATASMLKLVSGVYSDRLTRRKPLVVAGYGLASLVRPFVGLATAPWHVLVVRVTDRIGKGIRTSPRDALLADAAPPGQAGRAFGFHQAMDHAGAVIGPLTASALVALGLGLRSIFLWAAVPGVLATIVILLVREPARNRADDVPAKLSDATARSSDAPSPSPAATPAAATRAAPAATRAPLSPRFGAFLAILAVFSLGNSSDAFLLVRAHDLGVTTTAIPLLWTVLSLSKLASAYVAGDWSDRWPRVRFIYAGWAVYGLSYVALAFATQTWQAWGLFVAYGLYYGLTEPTQKALVRDITEPTLRGRAYGYYNFVVGMSALPAGLLMGALWQTFGPRVALSTGAALAGLGSVLLVVWSGWAGPPSLAQR